MKISPTEIEGLYILNYNSFRDNRGEFVKTIHKESFVEAGIEWVFTESFFSKSSIGVIRGMHFQIPPEAHSKLIYVVTGKILDVVLDIRHDSPTYGKFFSIELLATDRVGLYIGAGLAHGFLSLEDDTVVEYHTTTSQSKICERGVLWNSFGYKWPVDSPILSDRDLGFPRFSDNEVFFS